MPLRGSGVSARLHDVGQAVVGEIQICHQIQICINIHIWSVLEPFLFLLGQRDALVT